MKKMVVITLFVASGISLIPAKKSSAVRDPEAIGWRAPSPAGFLNSLFVGVFGRGPTPDEVNFYIDRDLGRNMGRGEAFWSLVATQEYNNMFGSIQGPYHVRWKSRQRETENGMTFCHCYFFTKDPSLTGGQPAVMQYVGVRTPWERYNFSAARAVTRMFAVYDPASCPSVDCGFNQNDLSFRRGDRDNWDSGPADNLVKDHRFAGFGSAGAWGTGLYSDKGIWWNSNNARSRVAITNLEPNQRPPGSNAATALYIHNASPAGPHVFGTTSQRINVQNGRAYKISLWAFGKNLASNGAVYIVVDPQWTIRPINLKGGSYGWTRFEGTFTANANYVDLRIISANTGETWITDVTMTAQ